MKGRKTYFAGRKPASPKGFHCGAPFRVYFFLSIFWLLLICTILSDGIQKQMTVKVKVLEPGYSGTETAMQVFSAEVLSGGVLYEAGEGSEWESGLRAEAVPPEFYTVEEGQVLLSDNIGGQILYRTKELFPGAVVQKTTPYKGEEGLYLVVSSGKEPQLLSMTGKEPYMENLQKEELGLVDGERLYSMTEVEGFSSMLIWLGILLALLISTLLLLIYGWRLSGEGKKNRLPFLTNSGLLVLLLLGISKIVKGIQLPSSLLPKENILDFGHYRETFGEILNALEKLGQMGNREAEEILQGFQNSLLAGCLAAIFGILACCIILAAESRIWKKRS